MRSLLLACVAAVLAALPAQAVASRCVDQVVLFAERFHVPIGAPGHPISPLAGQEIGETVEKAALPPGDGAVSGRALPPRNELLSDAGSSGPALKAQAKAMLSSLLNAALAAGEEGRSRACFKQLNTAFAVSTVSVQRDGANGWR